MDLDPHETVYFAGHPSWRSMAGLLCRGLLCALLAGVVAGIATLVAAGHVQAGWVVVAVLVVFALLAVVGQLRRLSTSYAITDRRLVIESGLLSRELRQTRLERVQNVSARQSLWERMLGIGTVDFDTAGEAGYDFGFAGVADPRGIVRVVDAALHALATSSARSDAVV